MFNIDFYKFNNFFQSYKPNNLNFLKYIYYHLLNNEGQDILYILHLHLMMKNLCHVFNNSKFLFYIIIYYYWVHNLPHILNICHHQFNRFYILIYLYLLLVLYNFHLLKFYLINKQYIFILSLFLPILNKNPVLLLKHMF